VQMRMAVRELMVKSVTTASGCYLGRKVDALSLGKRAKATSCRPHVTACRTCQFVFTSPTAPQSVFRLSCFCSFSADIPYGSEVPIHRSAKESCSIIRGELWIDDMSLTQKSDYEVKSFEHTYLGTLDH
jgi:hypothetical protein